MQINFRKHGHRSYIFSGNLQAKLHSFITERAAVIGRGTLRLASHRGWPVGQGAHDWEHLCVRDCRGTRMSVAYFENKRGVYSLVGTIKQIRKVL